MIQKKNLSVEFVVFKETGKAERQLVNTENLQDDVTHRRSEKQTHPHSISLTGLHLMGITVLYSYI